MGDTGPWKAWWRQLPTLVISHYLVPWVAAHAYDAIVFVDYTRPKEGIVIQENILPSLFTPIHDYLEPETRPQALERHAHEARLRDVQPEFFDGYDEDEDAEEGWEYLPDDDDDDIDQDYVRAQEAADKAAADREEAAAAAASAAAAAV